MPIKVTCTCGAAFAAKDELAGRTVACPKCQQPLTIPGGAPRPAPAQRPAAPAPQAAPEPAVPSIFDEAGMKAKQHTGQVCPSCYHPMKQGAILCVHCGYSLQLGRKMETQVHGKGDGGHGEAAAIALQRAAGMIEDDKKEEKKKLSEGMPWWAYLLLFCGAVGLLTMMMLLPPATATVVAVAFLGLGVALVGFYAWVMVIIIAFKENAVQGLCALLIPCYWWIYCIMRWDQCSAFFLIELGSSIVLAGLGAGYYYYESTKEQSYPTVSDSAGPNVVAIREAETDLLPIPYSRSSQHATSPTYAVILR